MLSKCKKTMRIKYGLCDCANLCMFGFFFRIRMHELFNFLVLLKSTSEKAKPDYGNLK